MSKFIAVFSFLVLLSGCAGNRVEPVETGLTGEGIEIQVVNQVITLRRGRLGMSIDAGYGGRITNFSLDGINAIKSSGEFFGSTFWPSPQKRWVWPPPLAIDTGPYQFKIDNDTLILKSELDPGLGIQVEKTIRLTALVPGAEIVYRMKNHTDSTVWLAPWEVTRVPGGYTFFPTTGIQLRTDIPSTTLDGVSWYHYQSELLLKDNSFKLLEDGREGWIANFNPENRLLFVKQFPDIDPPQFAPDEAEIEIFASRELQYVEVEQQGAFLPIPPGSTVDWKVTWFLQQVDQSEPIEFGSSKLVVQAREILGLEHAEE